MITKGTGPQRLGSPLKVGKCGGANQPSCKDELKRMAKKQGFNESYQNSMNVSNVGTMRSMNSGGSYMSPGHVNQAATAETKKRIKNVTSDSGYKAFTKNPNSKGVIRHVENFIEGGRKGKSNAVKFQLPTRKEASSLINIGKKYINSKNIMKDISFVDKAKAAYEGGKLALKYPNILSFGKKLMK
jgi:hypothetical protein|tara:strand:+ start:99 stop:656 length:558 start_codon:yes stop_codon:yes gene_type:complete